MDSSHHDDDEHQRSMLHEARRSIDYNGGVHPCADRSINDVADIAKKGRDGIVSTSRAVGRVPPGDHTRTLKVGELERSYLVHAPPKYERDTPTSVVLVYHGGGSNAEVMVRFRSHGEVQRHEQEVG